MSIDKRRGERPVEQPAVKTTIVGGRPPGSGKSVGAIPRGIEVLVKKASVDPEFRALLLAKRGEAAREIGLELEPAEAAMLGAVSEAQLGATIAQTSVSPISRAAFLGKAASVMLAALGAASGCGENEKAKWPRTRGHGAAPVSEPKRPKAPEAPDVVLPEVKTSDLRVRSPKVGEPQAPKVEDAEGDEYHGITVVAGMILDTKRSKVPTKKGRLEAPDTTLENLRN